MIIPSPEEFAQLAERYAVVPVEMRVLADPFTPIALYRALHARSRHSFLLESVQGSERRSRYSFLGFGPTEIFGLRDGAPFMLRAGGGGGGGSGAPVPDPTPPSPLDHLRRLCAPGRAAVLPGLPPLAGGAVGYIGYDAAPCFGDVRLAARAPSGSPEMLMMTYDLVLAFDHRENTLSLIASVFPREGGRSISDAYADAVRRLTMVYEGLYAAPGMRALPVPVPRAAQGERLSSSFPPDRFLAAVRRIKEFILAGDVFQAVLSQRFTAPVGRTDPLDIYRVLRFLNPSPYMYFLETGEFQVIGASPEALVRYQDGIVEVRPIAGTRRRGADPEEDRRLEEELKRDPKELAEHVMLVDLGRNDVGRVAVLGSVEPTELFSVERYSHVMHLVSNVRGRARADVTALDALAAGFPAGTVTGAPKIRAMQILDELEPVSRGLYAGGIGYFSFAGAMDSCIAIRTMVVKDGVAQIQAGAGIVADSDPEAELQETINKAEALHQALLLARSDRT